MWGWLRTPSTTFLDSSGIKKKKDVKPKANKDDGDSKEKGEPLSWRKTIYLLKRYCNMSTEQIANSTLPQVQGLVEELLTDITDQRKFLAAIHGALKEDQEEEFGEYESPEDEEAGILSWKQMEALEKVLGE